MYVLSIHKIKCWILPVFQFVYIIISIAAGIIKDKFTLSNVHNLSMLTFDNALYDMNKVCYVQLL